MSKNLYYQKRIEKGYTQAYLAEMADTFVATVWRLENGGNVGIKIVEKIEKILDIFKK